MLGEKRLVPKLIYRFDLEGRVPADHLLRRVAGAVDFGFARGLTARFYSRTGQPGIDPVVLFKLGLLGYLYGITSERRLAEACRLNLAFMWFLGYDVDEPTPDHSALSKARARFGLTTYQAFFTEIVRQCERAGLVRGGRLYADSTLVRADASLDSVGARALVEQRLAAVEDHVAALWRENPAPPPPSPPPNVVPIPHPTAPAAEPVAMAAEAPGSPVAEAAAERTPAPAEAGALPTSAAAPSPGPHPLGPGDVPNGPQGPVNALVVSRTDPDAGLVARDGVPLALYHKLHVGVDGGRARIITAVDVTAGEVADEGLLDRLCKEHEGVTGRTLAEVVADAKYGVAANYRLLEAAGIAASIPLHRSGREHRAVPRATFVYDAERDRFVCPEGQALARQGWSSTAGTSGGVIYRASPSTCRACARKLLCCGEAEARTVTRTAEEDVRGRARASLATGRAKTSIRRRKCWAETAMAELKERHGCRRASGRGRPNVRIQAFVAAIAYNVKKLARSSARRPHQGAATASRPTLLSPPAARRRRCPQRSPVRPHPFRPSPTRFAPGIRSAADFGNRPQGRI